MEYSNYTNITQGIIDEDKLLAETLFYWMYIRKLVVIVVACVGLPLSLLAIYSLYKEVKADNLAPVYLINLLVSDLIQMCSSVSKLWTEGNTITFDIVYEGSLLGSVGFMVCISVERYLLVAFPLWYRFRRNTAIRNSVIVSLLVWGLSVIVAVPPFLVRDTRAALSIVVSLLLPFPVLIFSLFGTLKPLLASTAVSRKEKQRIVTVLVLVLFNYMLLFLPFIMWVLKYLKWEHAEIHRQVSRTFLQLNPLLDLLLYVVMRRGTFKKLRLILRCCRKAAANQPSHTIAENQAAREEGEEGGACEGAEPH